MAAENPVKTQVVQELLARHANDQVLIIGQYLDQLKFLATLLNAPLLTGRTNNAQREKLYERFRRGEIKRLVVSKVANFAVDLPDANVAIQVSGTFGSRQEEAQRLGTTPAAKDRRPPGSLLYHRDTRHSRPGLLRQPAALPDRTGLPLYHRGRRGHRTARPCRAHQIGDAGGQTGASSRASPVIFATHVSPPALFLRLQSRTSHSSVTEVAKMVYYTPVHHRSMSVAC